MDESSPPARRAAFGAALGNFVCATPMVNAVFGLFLIPLAREFGWPRAQVSLVLAIVALAGVVGYPLIGRLADRHGLRPLLIVGNLLFAAALAGLATIDGSLVRFYGLYALVGLAAAVPSTVLLTKLVSGWFVARRGLMLGLTAGLGNGAGATVMPVVGGLLMAHFGWRGAYLGLAAITLLIGLPAFLFLVRDPLALRPEAHAPAANGMSLPGRPKGEFGSAQHEGRAITLREAMATATFWMLLVSIAFGAGSMTAVFAHVVPMLLDRGLALGPATGVLATFALVCVAWQIGIGVLLDRVGTPRIAAPFYLAALAGLLLFQSAGTGLGPLFAAAALMGIGLGTEYGVLPYYVARYFGLRAYGAIYGVVYGTIVLTMGITPFLMDAVYDRRHSYDLAVEVIAVALLIGAALLARLKPYDALAAGVVPAGPAVPPEAAPVR